MIYKAILLLPLVGALSGLFYKRLPASLSQIIPTASVVLSAILSVFVFFTDMGLTAEKVMLFSWIDVAGLKIDWAFRNDALTRMMLPVITVVSSLVHIYSFGYMHDDESKPRFFAYLLSLIHI